MSNDLELLKIQHQLKTTLANVNRRPIPAVFDASSLQAQIDDLQAQIDDLVLVDGSLQSQIDAINLTLATIQNEINIIVGGALYEARTVTADTVNSATRAWDTIWCDASAGDITVTLTPRANQIINIAKTSTANNVIIDTVGGALINGLATKTIIYQWTSVKLQSDGVDYVAQ